MSALPEALTRIADTIDIDPTKGVVIDGEPFPYAVGVDTVRVEVREGINFVHLGVMCDRVRIDSGQPVAEGAA